MTLVNRAFEKRIRRQAKIEMRADKLVWKDYKRHRPRWRIDGPGVGTVWFYFIVASAMANGRAERFWTIPLGFALYATAAAFYRTSKFLDHTLSGLDRQVLFTLPFSDSDYLKYKWTRYLKSWWSAFGIYAIGCGILLYREDTFDWKYVCSLLGAAVLLTACGITLGLWQIAAFSRTIGFQIYVPFAVATIGALFLDPAVARQLWPVVLVTPAGWVTHAMLAAVGLSPASDLLWLITALGFTASLPTAWRTVRSTLLESLGAQTVVVSVPDEAAIDSSETTPTGWIEKLVEKQYSPRQRAVASLMRGEAGQGSSNKWKYGACVALAGVALAYMPVPFWVAPGIYIVMTVVVTPVFAGNWSGFDRFGAIPRYARYPVRFDEICQVILIANMIQIFLWIPMGLILALAQHDLPFFGKTFIILLALQPLFLTLKFAVTTNARPVGRVWIHVIAILILAGTVLWAAVLLIANFRPAAAAAGLLIASVLILLVYRSLFNNGHGIDLLSLPS